MAENTNEPITIKKYANRRLYNKATSTYVTLDHLAEMVKEGVDFVVHDAKTGEDITRSVLTQIIVEEESKGQSLLPTTFLRHLISFYGDSMQGLVPRYLEYTMQVFAKNQEQFRSQFTKSFDGLFPFPALEEVNRNNMRFFDNLMGMFSLYSGEGGADGVGNPDRKPAPANPPRQGDPGADSQTEKAGDDRESLDDMREKLDRMQRQLDALARKSDKD